MNLERRVSFPDKPEFDSPYFSYQVSNPEKTGGILRSLRDRNDSFVMQIGEETHGFLNHLRIGYTERANTIRGLTFSTHFNLPMDYFEHFIGTAGLPPFSSKARRNLRLQDDIKKYVSKDLRVFEGVMAISVLNRKGQVVAHLPCYQTSPTFIYQMPEVIPSNNSTEQTLLLKTSLEDALKTLIIYTSHLYRYRGINADSRSLTIDPSLFKLISESPRDFPQSEKTQGDSKITLLDTLMFGPEGYKEDPSSLKPKEPEQDEKKRLKDDLNKRSN